MPGPRVNQMLQDELKKKGGGSKRSSRRWSRLSLSRRSSFGANDEPQPPMPGPQENKLLQDELNKRANASGNVAAGVETPMASKRSSRRWSRFSRRNSMAEPDTALPPMPSPADNQMLQDQLKKHAATQRSNMNSPSGSEPMSEATRASDKNGSKGLFKSMGLNRHKNKKATNAD